MTKLFMIFLSILAGVFLGLALMNKNKSKEKYFEDLISVIERLISDIKFSQRYINDILKEGNWQNIGLKKNIDEYFRFLNGGELVISKGFLNKNEHSLVEDFFKRLGMLDLDTQLGELAMRKEVFKEIHSRLKEKNSKFGSAYIKLGFLGGLLVGILMI